MNGPVFDVFKREAGGRFVWLGTASNLLEANSKIRSVSEGQAEFLIVNEETGERTVVKPSDDPPLQVVSAA